MRSIVQAVEIRRAAEMSASREPHVTTAYEGFGLDEQPTWRITITAAIQSGTHLHRPHDRPVSFGALPFVTTVLSEPAAVR